MDCRRGIVRRNNFVDKKLFASLFDFNIINATTMDTLQIILEVIL